MAVACLLASYLFILHLTVYDGYTRLHIVTTVPSSRLFCASPCLITLAACQLVPLQPLCFRLCGTDPEHAPQLQKVIAHAVRDDIAAAIALEVCATGGVAVAWGDCRGGGGLGGGGTTRVEFGGGGGGVGPPLGVARTDMTRQPYESLLKWNAAVQMRLCHAEALLACCAACAEHT